MSKNSKRNKRRAAAKQQARQRTVSPENVSCNRSKLAIWQERLALSNRAYGPEVEKMDDRERLYNGDRKLYPLVAADTKPGQGDQKANHVRNIIFENIESQISSSIPQPKVTPRRQKDEVLAARIEHFLRNELDRQNFETMNDMAERTVLIQGGVGYRVEWDNTKRTHMTVGEANVGMIHPKQIAPQPGVFTGIDDMDWFIVKIPSTKEAVRRRYDKSVYAESESEPDVRSVENQDSAEDAVTVYEGYEKADGGGINKYVWVNDVELEDLENYQARHQPTCCQCGRVRPMPGQVILSSTRAPGNLLPDPMTGNLGGLLDNEQAAEIAAGHILATRIAAAAVTEAGGEGILDGMEIVADEPPQEVYDGGPCPWCGCEDFADQEQEFEQVILPITTSTGVQIPGATAGFDEMGNAVWKPTLIPFYKPDVYPFILQRSVSVYGQLLGNSDVDAIRDQQNTINRLEKKIIDRLLKAGTRITLPDRADLKLDPVDGERWYISAAEKACINVYEFKGDLQYELAYLSSVYEEARQILGITDAFQGRRDTTATSGAAKEFSAAQAAGRLESKRVMKNAAYARIFEILFKFWLAYSDEPRPVSYKDFMGTNQYEEFSRYDFLEKDSSGQYYWNDQFLFSCDTSAPLASNREAMWQETRMNLQTGAFGDPSKTDTLILFWSKMELLHYPGAGQTKKFLEERLKQEMKQAAALQPAGGGVQVPGGTGMIPENMPVMTQGSPV